MPFDSFLTRALAAELSASLNGLKVDRIFQPERDEIDLVFHRAKLSRLIISCAASAPYMALSDQAAENPASPPMMCMLLRKHLSRAKISAIEQVGFDRVIRISFDSGDEMGFRKTKYLYCEMMGRGSNLVFVDENGVILTAFRQNDITTKFGRVVMNGMPYQPMPLQDKKDPQLIDQHSFVQLILRADPEERADLFLQKQFFGFGKLTAREAVYRTAGDAEAVLAAVNGADLWNHIQGIFSDLAAGRFEPTLIYASRADFESRQSPLDFSFFRPRQFPSEFYLAPCESISEAIESFYLIRGRAERRKQHYNDIAQILKTCKNRLEKKIAAQEKQLYEAQNAEEDKRLGDLITQELFHIRRGDSCVDATDYSADPPEIVHIELDRRLTPSANAQRYYREYTKKKTAQVKVVEQIEIARSELDYANSILASLETAEDNASLEQIRQEISHWSYGRRLCGALRKPRSKPMKAAPLTLISPGGNHVLVGRNNLQNDAVSFRLAEKGDLWFHVKAYHGSHVLLKCDGGSEPKEEDIAFAAGLAAYYSEVGSSERVEVDMTRARFLKKTPGGKPGFVTYRNQKTLIVCPKTPK